MPNPVLVQVIIPMDSGLPEDSAVNNWHFATVDPEEDADSLSIVSALADFYHAIDAFMSREVTTHIDFKFYNLNDPMPRVPYHLDTEPIVPATTGKALPSEVALCLSFRGEYISGGINARERGRVFLGPWNEDSGGASPDNGRPAPGFVAAVRTAADNLLVASGAAAGWGWTVFSPTRRAAEEEEYFGSAVVGGWIDNAWDTQRRRGVAPTSRDVF